MYRKRKVISVVCVILFLALVGTSVWGYQERTGKQAMLIRAENNYQRAFYELSEHVDKLEDELGKTLALNSRRKISYSLAQVWRLSNEAQGDISQLPLTYVPFDDVRQFLSQVSNFAYKSYIRDLDKEPFKEKEYQDLQTLYKRAGEIQDKIFIVQRKIVSKQLSWMDAEKALVESGEKNNLVDGVGEVNHMVKSYPNVDLGGSPANSIEVSKRKKIASLKGQEISAAEAKRAVAKFIGINSTENMSVVKNAKGDYRTYSVRYEDKHGMVRNTDVTVIGGYVVWMEADRHVDKKKIGVKEADQRARQFLDRIKQKKMAPISYSETGNVVILTYVHKEDGIYIYPETVSVKVALDTGEIIGYDGDEFLFNQISLPKKQPEITLEQAKRQINPKLKIERTRLAVIYSEEGEKVLCYEILGSLSKGDQYRLFINANTAQEEFIEKINAASY